jgi:hypothetical protein
MKKFIVLSLSGLLILALGATVYGQDKLDFKASGYFRFNTEYLRNNIVGGPSVGIYDIMDSTVKPGGKAWNTESLMVEQRVRLKFDMAYGKEVSGTFFLESDAGAWGNADGTRNSFGYYNGDRAAVEVKRVYLDYAPSWIGLPINFRFGLQGNSIRDTLLMSTDGTGVSATIKVDPVNIIPFWFKASEGSYFVADDSDLYGLHMNAKLSTFTIGGYGMYFNMRAYPLRETALSAYTQSAKIWWAGVYADGKMGPLDLNFDFIYDNGKVNPAPNQPTWSDVKYSGWLAKLHVAFPIEKFTIGVGGMYASGADTKQTDYRGDANGTNTKVKAFVTPPGSEAGTSLNEALVFYGNDANSDNSGIACAANSTRLFMGGLGGTWFAKLYGSYMATPWYKVTLQGYYIGDTTKNGNTVGNARKADGTTLRDDKVIGYEADLINVFSLTKQLQLSVGAGFFVPANGMAFWYNGENRKPSAPYTIASEFIYRF